VPVWFANTCFTWLLGWSARDLISSFRRVLGTVSMYFPKACGLNVFKSNFAIYITSYILNRDFQLYRLPIPHNSSLMCITSKFFGLQDLAAWLPISFSSLYAVLFLSRTGSRKSGKSAIFHAFRSDLRVELCALQSQLQT
jgi:hypothetical protein